MLTIDRVSILSPPAIHFPSIHDLGTSHSLSNRRSTMLERCFGLETISRAFQSHPDFFAGALNKLVDSIPCSSSSGLLIYAKTQTHNTMFDLDWLRDLAISCGLHNWEVFTLSMNHCASALSAIHAIRKMSQKCMTILLTGEKSFHPEFSQLGVGVIGELPTATLFNATLSNWAVVHTSVEHKPQYFRSPKALSVDDRVAVQTHYLEWIRQFLNRVLESSHKKAVEIDLIVPFNLNLPMLKRLAADFGWQDKLFTGTISQYGHLFCSDIPLNLSLILPTTKSSRILAFAVGLGMTFSSLLLERIP